MRLRPAAISALVALCTAAQTPASARPNIVFAIADDWGWPHAGAYGDEGVKTPTFDRLAMEGVLVENAYISSPSCTPSRGAIITGQQFWRLGPAGNLWSVWPSTFPEYPRMLAGEGYFVGSYRKGWGPGTHPATPVSPAGKIYQSVDAFFDARPNDMPFCLWFGASDPHRPYEKGSGVASGVELVERLEEMGEFENTLIVITGDHGMPFPRAKGSLYDSGARVPMAIRWAAEMPGGRTVTDFVSTTDIAPTFLDAAGVEVPSDMTGRSLLPILRSGKSGRVSQDRDHVLFGRERHVVAQEAPEMGGYPARGIRTDDYLYIRNYEADRWPAGTPHYEKVQAPNAWLADCDNSPTKWFLWENRNDPALRKYYELSFAKRPAEELYDLQKDPGQVVNVAGDPEYVRIRKDLSVRLTQGLLAAGDPRIEGRGALFDSQPYLGGSPRYPQP